MGNYVSCSSTHLPPPHVKIIHRDARVQVLDQPLKVAELMIEHPFHFLCQSDDLQARQRPPALAADEELELGKIYFLLPLQSFQSALSLEEFKCLSSLTRVARNVRVRPAPGNSHAWIDDTRPLLELDQKDMPQNSVCLAGITRKVMQEPASSLSLDCFDTLNLQLAHSRYSLSKSKSWRPKLDTIREVGSVKA